MQSRFGIHKMSRRTFGKLAAIGTGAGATVMRAASGSGRALAAEQSSFTDYSFYPLDSGELRLCNACLSHAENKRFATRDAAEANRAHKGCNCPIFISEVSAEEYGQFFGGTGSSSDRTVYDLRWASTPQPASA